MRILSCVKDAVRPAISRFYSSDVPPSWKRTLRALKRNNLTPNTVFDVGVAYGTFPLYQEFPDAFYHLIDPAQESKAYMERLSSKLRSEIHCVALGDRDCETAFEVRSSFQESTLLEEVGHRSVRRTDRVKMRRFDTLFEQFDRPALCKIDVQGAELMVLAGMRRRLSEIDAIIVEVSTIATLKNGPEVQEVMEFMRQHRFVLADVIGVRRRPLDGVTAQVDLLFVPHDSVFRSDRRWSESPRTETQG